MEQEFFGVAPMFRVVTQRRISRDGQVRRDVQTGPWQPSEEPVRRWAEYLRNTGNYDRVDVQSMKDRDGVQSNRF